MRLEVFFISYLKLDNNHAGRMEYQIPNAISHRQSRFHHTHTLTIIYKSVVTNWIQIYQIQSQWNLQIIKRGQPFDELTAERCSIQQMFCKNKHLFRT